MPLLPIPAGCQAPKTNNVLSLMYDCIIGKMRDDAIGDANGVPRQPLPDYIRDHLLQKFGCVPPVPRECVRDGCARWSVRYASRSFPCAPVGVGRGACSAVACRRACRSDAPGCVAAANETRRRCRRCRLPTLAESYLYSIVEVVRKNSATNGRLRLLGSLCGVLEDGVPFDPHLADFVLHFVRTAMPASFSAAVLRNAREGGWFIVVDAALAAIAAVAPDEPVAFAVSTLWLSPPRRAELLAAVRALAGPSSEARVPVGGSSKAGAVSVVDFDALLVALVRVWAAQVAENQAALRDLYFSFDKDGNGVLTFDEFKRCLVGLVPRSTAPRQLLHMFTEAIDVSKDGVEDSVTVQSFLALCAREGLAPNGGDTPAASSRSSPASAVGEPGGGGGEGGDFMDSPDAESEEEEEEEGEVDCGASAGDNDGTV